jgi:hypothetical protein
MEADGARALPLPGLNPVIPRATRVVDRTPSRRRLRCRTVSVSIEARSAT